MTEETSQLAIDISTYIPHYCQYSGCPYNGSLEEIKMHKNTCKYKVEEEQNFQDNDTCDKDDWIYVMRKRGYM